MSMHTKLSRYSAVQLGDGNKAGFNDYVLGRPSQYTPADETSGVADPMFVRGYLAGYRLASKGRRPQVMELAERAT